MKRVWMLVLLGVATSASADTRFFWSGQQWMAAYKGNERTLALGYVMAAADNAAVLGQACPGENVTSGQIAAVAVKYLEENPEHWDWPAIASIVGAMRQAWPCAKKSASST